MQDPYIMGYSAAYLRILSSRTAAVASGYLMPCLKPGHSVLDVGCGPGSISVGLAEAAGPGELHGIDIEPSQVEMSGRAARERGLGNAKFSVADVKAMPFEDGSFDVIHCNDTLAFTSDVGGALKEMKRVLKSGGILGCREIIMDSFLIHPDTGTLTRGYGVFADILAADGGHPQLGKDLARHLAQAGFTEIRISASFEVFSGPERLELFHDLGEQWFFTDEVEIPAEQYGAATRGLIEEIRQARDEWRQSTGAMAAFAFGEALAVKP